MEDNLIIIEACEMLGKEEGLYIQFKCDDTCHVDDVFTLSLNGKDRYFNVQIIKAISDFLYVVAKEYGYYDKLFKIVDVRHLLHEKLTKVTDKETLKRLARESCYL